MLAAAINWAHARVAPGHLAQPAVVGLVADTGCHPDARELASVPRCDIPEVVLARRGRHLEPADIGELYMTALAGLRLAPLSALPPSNWLQPPVELLCTPFRR